MDFSIPLGWFFLDGLAISLGWMSRAVMAFVWYVSWSNLLWYSSYKTFRFISVCGVSVGLIPLVTHSYALLVSCAVLFGLTFASSFSFTPIILVRLVNLDDFTLAYGLILLVQGVGRWVNFVFQLNRGYYFLFILFYDSEFRLFQ